MNNLNADAELTLSYRIEIDNVQTAGFEKCTGLNFKWAVGQTRTGTDPLHNFKYSGLQQFEDVTLTKQLRIGGAADNKVFWDWHKVGSSDKRSMSIVGLSRTGDEVRRWNLSGVWISDIKSVDYDASQEADAMIDEIILSIDYGENV